MTFDFDRAQWKTAKHFLKNQPDGTKLTYSAKKHKNKLVPRVGKHGVKKFTLFEEIEQFNRFAPPQKKLAQTTNSFTKLGGEYYAVQQGHVLGKGVSGEARLLKNRHGQLFIQKKEVTDDKGRSNISPEELEVLQDRGLAPSRHPINYLKSRQDSSQKTGYFTRMEYLGVSLDNMLTKPLDEKTRFDIAIKLCLEIHDLHCVRSKSLSKNFYAHRDLKLANVTWRDGKVHLIDFGMTDKYPKRCTITQGSPLYLPGPAVKHSPYTGEQLDIFALKRCLFMPTSFYCCTKMDDGYVTGSNDVFGVQSILNEKILNAHPDIATYVNTSSPKHPPVYWRREGDISACSLAAILIVAKLKLKIDGKLLTTDLPRAMAISAIYMHSKKPKNDIKKVLADENQIKAHAAFAETNNYEKFKEFMGEPAFCEAMKKAKTHKDACALVFLRQHGLTNYEGLQDKNIVDAIHKIYKLPKVMWEKETLSELMQHSGLVTMINQGQDYVLQIFFHKATAPDFKAAYTAFEPEILKMAMVVFSSNLPTDPKTSPTIFRALCIAEALKCWNYYKVIIASDPLLAQAIINIYNNPIDQWGISIDLLLSQDKATRSIIIEAYNIGVEHVKRGGKVEDLPKDLRNINNAKAVCFLSKNQCNLSFDPDRAEDLAFLDDINNFQCKQKELDNFLKQNRELKQHSHDKVRELFILSKSKLPQQEKIEEIPVTPSRDQRFQNEIIVTYSDSDSESTHELEGEPNTMDSGFFLDCCSQLSCGKILGLALISLILVVSIAGICVATAGAGLLGAAAGAVLTAGIVGAAASGTTLAVTSGYLFFSGCRKDSEEVPGVGRPNYSVL